MSDRPTDRADAIAGVQCFSPRMPGGVQQHYGRGGDPAANGEAEEVAPSERQPIRRKSLRCYTATSIDKYENVRMEP